MINKTENNTKKKVEKAKADASYFSKDNIEEIEEKEIDAYIPDKAKTTEERQERNNEIPENDRRNFRYDEEKDEFICAEASLWSKEGSVLAVWLTASLKYLIGLTKTIITKEIQN